MAQRVSAKAYFLSSIKIILPAAILLIAGIIAIPSVLVYLITHPDSQEPINPSYYLLTSSDVRITADDGTDINGWWIPGEEDSPGIALATGYGMSRSGALSLATELHKRGFNILIPAQRGSSVSSEKSSTFGLKESGDMLSALRFLKHRPESNNALIGIWGVDVGAYSALQAAADSPEVRAIAADSPYDSIYDFLDVRLEEEFVLENRLIQFGCRQIFRLIRITSGSLSGTRIPVERLSDRSLLLIRGDNRKKLGELTSALYEKLPSPKKELISLKTSRVRLTKEGESKEYDMIVADFFQQNLK
jgi:pimeloyl-ACP methyl ester carboxylesterase